MADEQLGELCLTHLEPLIPSARQRYLGCRVMRTPIAHPVFLRDTRLTAGLRAGHPD